MGVPKVMFFLAIVISAVLYWATSNVCRYNFALEKRTNILNIVTEEIDPNLAINENEQNYLYSKCYEFRILF